jgi:hypothetical protein
MKNLQKWNTQPKDYRLQEWTSISVEIFCVVATARTIALIKRNVNAGE